MQRSSKKNYKIVYAIITARLGIHLGKTINVLNLNENVKAVYRDLAY